MGYPRREGHSGNPEMPELSLIVPTYNEADNLSEFVDRVRAAMKGYSYEIIVVDDDSPDNTAGIAKQLAKKCPINLVVRSGERGLASAVVTGFGYAKGTVLGVLDADLQHPPEHVPPMLQEIRRGADIAIASRYSPGGRDRSGAIVRKAMSRAATLLGRTVLRSARSTPDPLSGFFLLRREVIDGLELKPVGYKILLEVLARGRVGQVKSLPYVFRQRKRGKSKFGWGEQTKSLGHMFRLAVAEYRRAGLFRLGG